MRIAATLLTGVIIALVGVLLGAWWTPFVVGVALGLVVRRPLIAIPLGAISGFLSWMLPMAGQAVRYDIGPTTLSLAEIMGFGHAGTLPVILTLAVGTLLGLTGAWLACAARLVVPAPR